MAKPRYVKLFVDLWGRIGSFREYGLFVYLLQRAEHKGNRLCGRGQVLTSYEALSKVVGASEATVKRSLGKLSSLGLLDRKGDRKGTLVTICDYDSYNGLAENVTRQMVTSEEDNIYKTVIEDLNDRTGGDFKWKAKYIQGLINERLDDGYCEADFIRVNKFCCETWSDEFQKHINPKALYGPEKMAILHGKAVAWEKKNDPNLKKPLTAEEVLANMDKYANRR